MSSPLETVKAIKHQVSLWEQKRKYVRDEEDAMESDKKQKIMAEKAVIKAQDAMEELAKRIDRRRQRIKDEKQRMDGMKNVAL